MYNHFNDRELAEELALHPRNPEEHRLAKFALQLLDDIAVLQDEIDKS